MRGSTNYTGYIIFGFIVLFITNYFWAAVTSRLALHKGYVKKNGSGQYASVGLFLGFLGFLYVGFLPEAPSQRIEILREALNPMMTQNKALSDLLEETIWAEPSSGTRRRRREKINE